MKTDFLRGFVQLLENSEVPDTFALWCAVSGVSCALGRKVLIDRGLYTLRPNFFILLVAGPGVAKKSTAIGAIEDIVRELLPKVNLISQKLSPEALIEAMMVRERVVDGKKYKDNSLCEGFITCDELVVFLNRKSYEAGLGSLMIPLFDCKKHFEYRTKARGIEEINNACLGFLSASTVHSIKDAIPEDAIHIGLASRMIFVYSDDRQPPVAEPSMDRDLFSFLVKELREIRALEGTAIVTEGARALHNLEYDRFHYESSLFKDEATKGYASRRFQHAIKLALVLAVVENKTLIVEQKHIRGAIDILEENEENMGRVIKLITTTEAGLLQESVLSVIRKFSKGLSRTDLMRKVSHKMDSKKLSETLETLVGSGKVEATVAGRGRWFKVSQTH